jgi:hypothetical protein
VRSPGQPPPPGSIVVREGKVRDVTEVVEEAEADRQEREDDGSWDGIYRLSVFAGVPENGEQLDETVVRLFDGFRTVRWYRVTYIETLRQGGFEASASKPDPYHYDVLLGKILSVAIVQKFEACFGQEIRNKACKRRS